MQIFDLYSAIGTPKIGISELVDHFWIQISESMLRDSFCEAARDRALREEAHNRVQD